MAEASVTKLGTPCSPQWTDSWVAKVEAVEKQMGRRICGAHSPAWTPCKLSSTHKNGRCRFHGGAEGIGAPNGNRNALIHGLYSRRLQRCGMQCPVWQWCPMSGKDVLALDPKERPNCVYEEQEYNALTFFLGKKKVSKEEPITSSAAVAADDAGNADTIGLEGFAGEAAGVSRDSGLRRNDTGGAVADAVRSGEGERTREPKASPHCPGSRVRSPSPASAPLDESSGCDAPASDPASVSFGSTFSFPKEKVEEAVEESAAVPLLHHNIATYQVMLTRAQAALAVSRFVDDTIAEGERYSMKSSKVAALLQAELRIGRELRQWIRLLANDAVRFALGLGPAKPEDPGPEEPEEELSLPMQMVPILKKAEGVLEHALVPSPPRPNPHLDSA